ncbi:MAG TPA: hypothetical protein VMU71_00225 [Terracidiphilus sp.]|nr:hypothetical protein [Terracidiphilus sp.]
MKRRLYTSALVAAGLGSLIVLTAWPAHALAAPASDRDRVSIHRMGGDIDVPNAPDGADVGTMGGNIHIGSAGGAISAKTMGGNIVVDHADGSVDVSTMGGTITVRQVSGQIHASTMSGDVTVHLTGASGDRRDIRLSSLSGAILLTVPKDYGMDVRIKLEYTRNSRQDFRVDQHLGLTERQTTDWDTSRGTPRKSIYVTGRVGDGQNRVTIETINGDVILKQE